MKQTKKLPEGAITIDNRYGRRFPKEKGYYGFIVGDRPAMFIHQMRKYTIDVYDEDDNFVTTFTCEHGEF